MLKLLFLLNYVLFLILTPQITRGHNSRRRTDMKHCTQRGDSLLVHSVGQWCALGPEGLSVRQVLRRCLPIGEAVRGVSKRTGSDTWHTSEGDQLGFFMGGA